MRGMSYVMWCTILLSVDCCKFPSILEGKNWKDSAKGKPVTFLGSTMTGWNVTFGTTVISSWECLFNQNNVIVFKSSYEQRIPILPPQTYYVYACMWIVSIEEQSFIYYLLADVITDANTRILRSTNGSLGACDACDFSLSLDSADGKFMTTTETAVPIPSQSGPCSGCSCIPTTAKQSSGGATSDQGLVTAAIVVPVVLASCILIAVVIAVFVLKYKKRNSKTCVEKGKRQRRNA